MAAIHAPLQDLSDHDRHELESWLVEFDVAWSESRLAERVRSLPPSGSPLRQAALVELIKIDLERNWQNGRQVAIESYLQDYPELGTADTLSPELLQVEYRVRKQFDATADLADFARRFPRQAEQLRVLMETVVDARPADPSMATPNPSPSTFGSAHPALDPQSLPEQFGRYRILKKLGQGGMGSVYLAHDSQLDRQVALKVPNFTPADGSGALERFHREARAAANLHHPNLCPVYDVGQIDSTHYLTMAFISGQPLSEKIKFGRVLSQPEAATLIRKIALALELAHGQGIIHRDLKPSNIMLNAEGEPVIMDFGLARRVNKGDAQITQSGAMLGTPAYMPPEQVSGSVAAMGPGCDIYSLGVILYQMLTGRLPFQGSAWDVLALVLSQSPEPPSKHRTDLDQRLESICMKAMAKKVGDRFTTMGDFAAALGDWLANRSREPLPQPAPSTSRSSSLRWLGIAAGSVATLAVVGIVIWIRTKQGDIKIEVDDPDAVVKIGDKEIPVRQPDDKDKGGKQPPSTKPPEIPSAKPSDAKASADPKTPAELPRGEVVKGRVDPASKTNQAHYWLIDLPAGEYKAVVDMELANRRNSNIQGEIQLLGRDGEILRKFGRFNEIDYRSRGVFPFRLDKPLQGIIRVKADQMMDYHLAVFPAAAAVPTPFFRNTPKVTAVKLGETFTAPALDGSKADAYDAFCSLTLPAGDYRVTVGFRRVDGKRSNIHGSVAVLSMDGMMKKKLGNVNEIDTRTTKTFKLALSEEQALIFRIMADQKLEGTLKVERLQAE
jgi:serine/threonine protein kinase